MRCLLPLTLSLACALALPAQAEAFCGFYVAGADTQLFNDATMVVMMRQGRRTVLSMQNSYKGPPENFAMVVPVPVVLEEQDVKILAPEVFDRVDHLAAPRLVEYWEMDPCAKPVKKKRSKMAPKSAGGGALRLEGSAEDLGVTIEAQFEVGEYEVVVLSAQDSMGLDTWLRQENYSIPAGAESLLRPYVQSGHKFFVAKVDVSKVKFVDGRVALSPLRVHYDSDDFSLPIRLGLINAGAAQDLIVHILADTRYEVANYPNVAIPTNLEVKDQTRKNFGGFYASLFDNTMRQHPGAVVTEYAWAATSCDPCPEPPLTGSELMTLGQDVLPQQGGSMTLTRLHARYDASNLGNDLVFQIADPIVGGREHVVDDKGKLEQGAVVQQGGWNNFQGRYIIRHKWKGPIKCAKPIRNRWGGPWKGAGGAGSASAVAEDTAFAPRTLKLNSYVQSKDRARTSVDLLSEGDPSIAPAPVPEAAPEPEPEEQPNDTAVEEPSAEQPSADPDPEGGPATIDDSSSGSAHCSVRSSEDDESPAGPLGLALLGLLGLVRRRRTRS